MAIDIDINEQSLIIVGVAKYIILNGVACSNYYSSMNKLGWLNADGAETETSDTQSSRSASPNNHHFGTINSKAATNKELLSKLSAMEATHLNQLHELTTQMAERELAYKEDTKSKEMELQQSQNRVTAVERRIRERDAQMTSLKDEKAGCLRQIADLKNQLYQLVSLLDNDAFDVFHSLQINQKPAS